VVDRSALDWLAQRLIAPILDRVPEGAHLVVVPHAILNYLPFELLPAEQDRSLVERNTISYAPSVSSFAYLRQRARTQGGPSTVLVVGNPATRPAPPAEQRQTIEWVGRLKPLPHTADEIRRIAAMFRPQSRLLEGASATEGALRSALPHVKVLHLATHALVDEERPDRSGLALTPGGAGNDGILQMREIYGLDLDAALVTLSACQTALGREVTGEGLVGLSRAFFYAGADAVTASLWSVNDRSTAELMTLVYGRLREGASIEAALAGAKRALLAGERTRHPYYWAAFIVTGNARARIDLPPPTSSMTALTWGLAAGGALLAAAIIAAAVRRRRAAVARA
jgi:CHAT domain-containing protein